MGSAVRTPTGDILQDLQARLESVYDTGLEQQVADYLVTDRELLGALVPGARVRDREEQLIVLDNGDTMDLALYLDPEVLERLAAADPREQLSGGNLADYWTVLEGISHFHYLAWNAALDKPVTLLELEMQAEVDKYVSTRLLLQQQPAASLGGPLLARLFDETVLDPELDAEEADRYHAASHLAGRYCAGLEAAFRATGPAPDLLRELRTFYRLSQTAKVARIRARGFA